MSEKPSDELEGSIQAFKELSISDKYSFNYNLVKVVDLTVHTVRQSWLLLKNSLPYELDDYLCHGGDFPDFEDMKRYIKYSALAYVSVYSAGTIICEVSKPDARPGSPKQYPFMKPSKSKSKAENMCVVIVAIAVLQNHTGIGLAHRLLEHTINKVKEAKLPKIFAIADENAEFTVDFYVTRGFCRSSATFSEVTSSIRAENSSSPCEPSFVVMEMALGTEISK